MDREYVRYGSLGFVLVLLAASVSVLLRRRRRVRSFREDPIGALKDRSEIVADKAQVAAEDAIGRLQDAIGELRGRLPELDRRQRRQRQRVERRLTVLSNQAQALLHELRSASVLKGKFPTV